MWTFGDGREYRGRIPPAPIWEHPSVYTLTLTATDELSNTATVSRTVTVTAPPPGPRGPPSPPATRPKPAAKIKLGSVRRRGNRIILRGTIARSADGKLRVAYQRRIRGRTRTAKTTAKIMRGRWKATLRLRGALARARRGKATLRISFAGDGDTRAGRIQRTVRR